MLRKLVESCETSSQETTHEKHSLWNKMPTTCDQRMKMKINELEENEETKKGLKPMGLIPYLILKDIYWTGPVWCSETPMKLVLCIAIRHLWDQPHSSHGTSNITSMDGS